MLSLARCRELLGDDAPTSDADVLALRDRLVGLADVAIDSAAERARQDAERDEERPAQEAACAR